MARGPRSSDEACPDHTQYTNNKPLDLCQLEKTQQNVSLPKLFGSCPPVASTLGRLCWVLAGPISSSPVTLSFPSTFLLL